MIHIDDAKVDVPLFDDAAVYAQIDATYSQITRNCVLCGEATGNEYDYICPDCRRVWLILKNEIFKE